MAELPTFQQQQYRFAAHIRDPERHALPDNIEDRRMGIYRDLFYNNVEGFLSNTLPVLRELMSDEDWHRMARAFFAQHHSHSPYFLDIPREFITWLTEEREPQADDLPFLAELAHYEWIELALSVAELSDAGRTVDEDIDLLTGIPLVSELAWPLTYLFPVHRIQPDFQPREPDETPSNFIIYRDSDDEVHFLELNPVSARLFGLIRDADATNQSTERCLHQIATELQHPDPAQIIQFGLGILQDWAGRGIILGCRRP